MLVLEIAVCHKFYIGGAYRLNKLASVKVFTATLGSVCWLGLLKDQKITLLQRLTLV